MRILEFTHCLAATQQTTFMTLPTQQQAQQPAAQPVQAQPQQPAAQPVQAQPQQPAAQPVQAQPQQPVAQPVQAQPQQAQTQLVVQAHQPAQTQLAAQQVVDLTGNTRDIEPFHAIVRRLIDSFDTTIVTQMDVVRSAYTGYVGCPVNEADDDAHIARIVEAVTNISAAVSEVHHQLVRGAMHRAN